MPARSPFHDVAIVSDPADYPNVLHELASYKEIRLEMKRRLAAKAFARGMNAVRLNQRNCGGTEPLATGLFHSGLTADDALQIFGGANIPSTVDRELAQRNHQPSSSGRSDPHRVRQ